MYMTNKLVRGSCLVLPYGSTKPPTRLRRIRVVTSGNCSVIINNKIFIMTYQVLDVYCRLHTIKQLITFIPQIIHYSPVHVRTATDLFCTAAYNYSYQPFCSINHSQMSYLQVALWHIMLVKNYG